MKKSKKVKFRNQAGGHYGDYQQGYGDARQEQEDDFGFTAQEEPEIDRAASYRELDQTFESLRGDYRKSSSRIRKKMGKSRSKKNGKKGIFRFKRGASYSAMGNRTSRRRSTQKKKGSSRINSGKKTPKKPHPN